MPHIKLSDISRNEEIDAIHARWQARLEPLRAELNQLAGQSWEEWRIPRPAEAETLPQLARALRAEINEEAWSAVYSTVSRPFPVPATGRIAVKVINHYGDEVLKVYEVG